jgi:putative transcriptional regulator
MAFFGGSFLIAKPVLRDPNFFQSVVLLVQHDNEGAFGLVVNRPLPTPKNNDLPLPVYAGGPCEAQGLFLLHNHVDWAKDEPTAPPSNEVAPGIFLGDPSIAPILKNLSKEDLRRVRLFAGYAGWGPGQLERELEAGAWALMPADGKTLFGTPAKELWANLRPPSIPQPSLN